MSNSFATPRTAARQATLSMGFPRQENWSGLPFPFPDLPNPGIEPASPALAGGFFTTELPECFVNIWHKMSLLKKSNPDFLSKFTWSFLHGCSHGSQTCVLTNTNLNSRSMSFVNTTMAYEMLRKKKGRPKIIQDSGSDSRK